MKIAQIVCAFPPYQGGIGNSAFNFAKILKKNNYKITNFFPNYGHNPAWEKNEAGEIIRLKPWLKYGKGAFIPQLFKKLKSYDCWILHYPFFGGAEIVWLAKLIFGRKKKLIIHYHMDTSKLSPLASLFSLPSRLIKNSLFKKAEIISCGSIDYIKSSQIKKIYKKFPNKFREIPFGVDVNHFYPLKNTKARRIKKILFVGGLDKAHYFKGINILLGAVAKIKNINWELDIVGRGELLPKYKKFAQELNIAEKTNFLTNIKNKDLPQIYQQADILTLPSINRHEAFGIVLLEAMACGIPVLASRLPGVRKVFEDGKQGFLVNPGEIQNLKKKIETILRDDQRKKTMGINARKLAKNKYSWEKIQKKILLLIKQAADNNSAA